MPTVLGNTPLDANVMLAPPYDAEVEYLETSGTQYIDTGVAVSDPSTIAIEADEDVAQPLGFTHQNVASGTWLSRYAPPAATQTLYIYYKNYNNRTTAPATETRKVARWDGSSGYYENGTSLVSFVASIDSDSIDGRNWLYGAVWDFNANAVDSRQSRAGKIYGLKVWVSGVLVRDFIPVRKNGVGYLYDRISVQLFGNAGTGDPFVLGPDVDVHNALVRSESNFQNLRDWLTSHTFTFKPTITFKSGWSASSDVEFRIVNGRMAHVAGNIKCTSALTAGTSYTPFSAFSCPTGVNYYAGCRLGANQRVWIYFNGTSTSIIPEVNIDANTNIYLCGLIPMTVNPDTATSYVKYIAPLF